ncbi:MAG TPA: PQQ-binding-like beta-propeller repeat protein [Bryobacterales bacterium]|nr:PQQ-binding-like beta-propeller repeat protein [Bryobacterales bacterium]
MHRSTAILLACSVIACVPACGPAGSLAAEKGQAEAKVFRDPAPPDVAEPSGKPPAEPREHPDVTFHTDPKPLHAEAVTHDWTSFLGPTHNAVSTETRLLKDFGDSGPMLVWVLEKGTSYTSPAIQGDYLVYLHRVGNAERVECLHPATGQMYWQFEYPTDFSDRYGYNNGPRASPVIDGDRVYTYGALAQLHAFDLKSGELLWKRNIAEEFKVPQDFFGISNTPLVEGGLLIINVGAPGGPTVAAFDKLTGRMVWGAGDEWGPSYASPVPAVVHGKRRVFVFAGGESRPPSGGLLSIDPSDGKVDFSFPWRSRTAESVNASTPTVIGDQVLISASYQTGAVLLEVLPDFSREVVWTNFDFDLHFMTAIEKDGYLYGFDGRNEPDAGLSCIRLSDGKQMWRVEPEWKDTVNQTGGRSKELTMSTFRGSLMKVDGHFLAMGEWGHLLWLDLTPEGYKEISRTWLVKARETWALPVLSRGLLYVSQNSPSFDREPPRLLCYDLRGK